MALQYLIDNLNNTTAVVVPIGDWEKIKQKHQDIDQLIEPVTENLKKTMKDFKGCISDETAKALYEHVIHSRNEWEERLNKQF
ncbi:MAG: hypothetical protein LH615_14995 [Ferruginibacter sp.]|nr:hypothetical protein [Ferruginibacter sp.]